MNSIHNYKELQKKVGQNIEHIRLLKRKTIKEIASSIKLSNTGYRNIERGITDMSISKLLHLAVILNVDQSQLLELDLQSLIKNEEHEKLSAQYVKQMEENYRLRIQQYKEENCFLKKQIEMFERLLANESVFDNKRKHPSI